MCVLCIEWEKGKMTSKEAFGAMQEIISTVSDKNHLIELTNKILASDTPTDERDHEFEKQWSEETYGHRVKGKEE
jgi:hypothetical protein